MFHHKPQLIQSLASSSSELQNNNKKELHGDLIFPFMVESLRGSKRYESKVVSTIIAFSRSKIHPIIPPSSKLQFPKL